MEAIEVIMSVICNAESSKSTCKTEYPSLINIMSNNEPIELISLSVMKLAERLHSLSTIGKVLLKTGRKNECELHGRLRTRLSPVLQAVQTNLNTIITQCPQLAAINAAICFTR